MTIDTWLLYIGTVLLFMATPGPSHLLMLSNSLANGFKRSTATAAGDLSANALQMIAASLGLAAALSSSQLIFEIVKWCGVAYLGFIGLRMILSDRSVLASASKRSLKSLYWQGFITSAANPKAVVFFAALFPQFISADAPLLPQFLILSVSYLVIDGSFLCAYGKFADTIRARIDKASAGTVNKVCGGLFIAAAIALGIKSVAR